MPMVLYEHPLNERIRNYLKLEQLFAQAKNTDFEQITYYHQVFFTALFSILDTLERNDIRGDLIKDLEKLEQNLVLWSRSPEVDGHALDDNIKKTVSLLCKLKSPSPEWLKLKDDKFLAGLKQRYAMQGGNSSFDLPQLTFWLNQSKDEISHNIHHWLALLDQISCSLSLILMFIRQRSNFENINVDNGFYQDAGEGILLLRIELDSKDLFYPTVSGNRFRYSIRFMLPCSDTGKKYHDQKVNFRLARC